MRLLLVNLCSDPLSELEFVKPLERRLKRHKIDFRTRHYTKIAYEDVKSSNKVIICGTALKDGDFLKDLSWFTPLDEGDKPILGIGSGSQAIMKFFNEKLIDEMRIGMFKVTLVKENKLTDKKSFYAYFLTKKIVKTAVFFEILARIEEAACMMKHKYKEVYGCFFHPEVMNPEIILNFTLKVN